MFPLKNLARFCHHYLHDARLSDIERLEKAIRYGHTFIVEKMIRDVHWTSFKEYHHILVKHNQQNSPTMQQLLKRWEEM